MPALADVVLALLPQTQCTRCGYADCAGYALAIEQGAAGINQCPPGGRQGIEWLAALTGQPVVALNPAHGTEGPRSMAFIDENWCIGCTLCIKACPTDAIVGSNQLMHTVIEAYCTGCELCIPVCPVDCIELENASGTASGWAAWSLADAKLARGRYQLNRYRRVRENNENNPETARKSVATPTDLSRRPLLTEATPADKKRAVIEAAVKHARTQRVIG
ncbi:MAG: electron transport complex subunit RsxB [Comamonadaceae bacterium]